MCADYRPCQSERVGRTQRIRPWPHVGRHPNHRSIIETTASHVARTQYRARVDFRQIPESAALRGHFHYIAKAGAATTSPLVSAWPVRSSADIGLPVSARTGRPRVGAGGAIHETVWFLYNLRCRRCDAPSDAKRRVTWQVGRVADICRRMASMTGRRTSSSTPLDFIRYIRVPHPVGAASGCENRQSCQFGIARLAALIPRPRAHLTRYHGVFER